MANELTMHAALMFRKGGAQISKAVKATIDVTGDAFTQGVQVIGTVVWEVLQEVAEIGTAGATAVKNLDSANYVEYSIDAAGANPFRINAGEIAVFRHAGADVYMKADTGDVTIEYLIIED